MARKNSTRVTKNGRVDDRKLNEAIRALPPGEAPVPFVLFALEDCKASAQRAALFNPSGASPVSPADTLALIDAMESAEDRADEAEGELAKARRELGSDIGAAETVSEAIVTLKQHEEWLCDALKEIGCDVDLSSMEDQRSAVEAFKERDQERVFEHKSDARADMLQDLRRKLSAALPGWPSALNAVNEVLDKAEEG